MVGLRDTWMAVQLGSSMVDRMDNAMVASWVCYLVVSRDNVMVVNLVLWSVG